MSKADIVPGATDSLEELIVAWTNRERAVSIHCAECNDKRVWSKCNGSSEQWEA